MHPHMKNTDTPRTDAVCKTLWMDRKAERDNLENLARQLEADLKRAVEIAERGIELAAELEDVCPYDVFLSRIEELKAELESFQTDGALNNARQHGQQKEDNG